jgi:DNA polymerase-1
MRYHFYAQQPEYPVCLLVGQIRKDEIRKAYFTESGVDAEDVLVLDLHYAEGKKKTPAAEMKAYITEQLQEVLDDHKVQYIMCTDSGYFKTLTGATNVDANLGYVLDSKFGSQKVVYAPSYRMIFHDPAGVKTKITRAIEAVIAHATQQYRDPGHGIIKFADYPQTDAEIAAWLEKLLEMEVPLTCDIEAFSLKHYDAGIGTISFAWNQHEGIAFPVDYVPIEGATEAPFGIQVRNERRRELLRSFFTRLTQKAIYHNIAFDVYVLIYQLFMEHICDTEGLLHGLEVMLPKGNWDCTKLITYLATNSCAGNELGLKSQAQEFAGNYAQTDIHDITRIPLPTLLEYNLVDCLSTWHVHTKHYPTMVADDQLGVYQTLFQPATVDIVQMQLTGMPVNMRRVLEVEKILQAAFDKAESDIMASAAVQRYSYRLAEKYAAKMNGKWKVKRITVAEVEDEDRTFNPRSAPQLQDLLFTFLGLPVLSLTDSKLPSTDGDTIEALINHTGDAYVKEFLSALLEYKAVEKILGTFIKALKNAQLGPDGWYYLFGNFNLGGTLSGRLSSNDPNLQNLPANASMAVSAALLALFGDTILPYIVKGKLMLGKLVKSCFEAPPGWLFCGLDFASLEDRISALTTKDPNKLKVYTDGYDGHCLRSFSYFGEEMPDIVDTVPSINSIETKYKTFRQDSKAPTFALTYQGTWKTLMTNCGFSEEKARKIEARYHELYKVSDDWVAAKLDQASKDGYVTVAFGLRVRTPLLHQVVRGNSRTPHQAEAEGRSAGNALGQSWCLLNSRASVEFMDKVRKSEYSTAIRPCAHIHDAQYYLVREDPQPILYTNEHLVKAVQWQDHPDIEHPDVKLGGELSIFFPSWENEIGIPNGATEAELFEIVEAAAA